MYTLYSFHRLSLTCLSSSFKAFAVVSITALLNFPLLFTNTLSKVTISTSLNRFRRLTCFFPRGAFASFLGNCTLFPARHRLLYFRFCICRLKSIKVDQINHNRTKSIITRIVWSTFIDFRYLSIDLYRQRSNFIDYRNYRHVTSWYYKSFEHTGTATEGNLLLIIPKGFQLWSSILWKCVWLARIVLFHEWTSCGRTAFIA